MYAVVQVRGVVKTRRDIKDTLKMLRLHHINHCVLIADSPENLGMIRKVKDYVAFGEVDAATVETLLLTRGRVLGDAPESNAHDSPAQEEFCPFAEIAETDWRPCRL